MPEHAPDNPRREFLRGRLEVDAGGQLHVWPDAATGSHRLAAAAGNDVLWYELTPRAFRCQRTPLDVSGPLRQHREQSRAAWVFTSATLAVGGRFDHFATRLGLDEKTIQRLFHKGTDTILKKIGEEATEVVMAAKDVDHGADKSKLVYEVADLWFHSMVALAHYGLTPADVLTELERREGTSGIEEKALRKVVARTAEEGAP